MAMHMESGRAQAGGRSVAVVAQSAPPTSPNISPTAALRRGRPGDPEFGAWLDDQIGTRFGPPDEPGPSPRTRWWWIKRGLAGLALAFILLVGWLAITAPLSKSLQPIAPPELTLLAADGTPIARNGADVDAPVKVSELPPHVIEPFIAIEGPPVLQPLGGRSARDGPGPVEQPHHRAHARRQHDHPAARQVHVPHTRARA
jgi:hypothetical protein